MIGRHARNVLTLPGQSSTMKDSVNAPNQPTKSTMKVGARFVRLLVVYIVLLDNRTTVMNVLERMLRLLKGNVSAMKG